MGIIYNVTPNVDERNASGILRHEPRKKFQIRRPRVTIAIGMISKRASGNQIVLAADSQTTWEGSAKSLNANKIERIRFLDGDVLLVHAGMTDLAARFGYEMQERAAKIPLEERDTAPRLMQEVMRWLRNELTAAPPESPLTEKEKGDRYRQNPLCFILGYYFERKPYLAKVDIETAVWTPITSCCEAIGCGDYLARFLMHEYRQADSDFEYAYQAAVHVIDNVIAHADGCGPPIKVGLLSSASEAVLKQQAEIAKRTLPGKVISPVRKAIGHIMPQQEIDWTLKSLKSSEAKLWKNRKKQMHKAMQDSHKEFQKWAAKDLRAYDVLLSLDNPKSQNYENHA